MCEHGNWISLVDLEAQAPAVCKGVDGPVDAILAFRRVDPATEPAVCLTCYEIAGSGGKKHEGLIRYEQIQQGF